MPRVGFRDGQDDYTRAIYRLILQTDPTTPEHRAAWGEFYQQIEEALEANTAVAAKVPGCLDCGP